MSATCLLIGPDDAGALAAATHKSGAKLSLFDDVDAALPTIGKGNADMIFIHADQNIPLLFNNLKENKLSTPIVAIGPAKPVQNAVKAVRLGAIEYLTTPVEQPLVDTLLEKFQPVSTDTTGPVAADEKTLQLIESAKQFSSSDATILLRGESGTGKEVFSKLIHASSPRADKPFVSVNCAAIPESLLESELFGHKKGAFSGAMTDRLGKFQQANGGTLLLDEVSEMDLALQAKLLRAIQERVIDPVGSDTPVDVDIRLIATTNRDLESYVAEGNFREDLYFRLNVVALDIPALRERPGDIPALAKYFAELYATQNGQENISISDKSLEKLSTCYWKGNVRELENTLHRAVLMAGQSNEILPEHIVISPMSLKMMEEQGSDAEQLVEASNVNAAASSEARNSPQQVAAARYAAAGGDFSGGTGGMAPAAPPPSLQDMERNHILNTLNYCQGNREHAADVLGISIKILKDKLAAYSST